MHPIPGPQRPIQSTRPPKPRRRVAGKITAFVLVLVLIASSAGAVWWFFPEHWPFGNSEAAASVDYTSGDSFVNQDFSDMRITDVDSAIAAVENYFGVTGGNTTFRPEMESSIDTLSYFRVAQYYRGIPVFARNVVAVADNRGDALALTGNYMALSGINVTPGLSEADAIAWAMEFYGAHMDAYSLGLVIYSLDIEPVLCYEIVISGATGDIFTHKTLLINAHDGTLVSYIENVPLYFNSSTDGRRAIGQPRPQGQSAIDVHLPYFMAGSTPVKFCNQRNIAVYSFGYQRFSTGGQIIDSAARDLRNWFSNGFNADRAVRFPANHNDSHRAATDAFYYTIVTYDFFAEHLNWTQIHNNPRAHLPVLVDIFTTDGLNAFYWPFDTRNMNSLIGFESTREGGTQFTVNLDVVVHEYVHGVNHATWNRRRCREHTSRLLEEALADIFGIIVEYYYWGSHDWRVGDLRVPPVRDIRDGQFISIFNLTPGRHHHDSKVISWVAREIAQSFDFHREVNGRRVELLNYAKLWHGVQNLLPSSPTLLNIADTIILQASLMAARGMITPQQLNAIDRALVDNDFYPTIRPAPQGEGNLEQQAFDEYIRILRLLNTGSYDLDFYTSIDINTTIAWLSTRTDSSGNMRVIVDGNTTRTIMDMETDMGGILGSSRTFMDVTMVGDDVTDIFVTVNGINMSWAFGVNEMRELMGSTVNMPEITIDVIRTAEITVEPDGFRTITIVADGMAMLDFIEDYVDVSLAATDMYMADVHITIGTDSRGTPVFMDMEMFMSVYMMGEGVIMSVSSTYFFNEIETGVVRPSDDGPIPPSTGPNALSDLIIGTWPCACCSEDVITFNSNGTFQFTEPGYRLTGRFTIFEDNTLEIFWGSPFNEYESYPWAADPSNATWREWFITGDRLYFDGGVWIRR